MLFYRSALSALVGTSLLAGSALASQPREKEPSLREVMTRLDSLVVRIDQLDQRLRRLEESLRRETRRVDRHGIIRDATGEPIGVWGVDSDATTSR